MGVFNFMETFFFVSLGISFIMIIMIVYHFKQRIIIIEQKQDTMFEIINNIVKQIKNMQINLTYLGETQNIIQPRNETVVSFSNGIGNSMRDFDIMFNDAEQIANNTFITEENEHYESEDDESEEDADEEEDEDADADADEDEEDDADADEDEEDDADEEEDEDADVDEEEGDECYNETQSNTNIKVISIDIDENETIQDNLGILEFTEMNSSLENINELREEDIVIHKINNTNTDAESDTTKDNKDFYRKMNLSTLKSMVIEKGLSTDTSKLKKQELIKLLESSE